MGTFKKITHFIAAAGAVVLAFAVSDKGQAIIGGLVKAYPKSSALAAIIAFLATVYHNPSAASVDNP